MLKLYGQEQSMVFVMQHRSIFPPEKRVPAIADEHDAKLQPKLKVMKYDLSKYPHFQKWLAESVERPQAKQARKLRE